MPVKKIQKQTQVFSPNVDLQVNGFKGVDFSSIELTEDAFIFACRELRKNGTVAFLPTIITSSVEVYQKNLTVISKVREFKEFKWMLPGVHLEGPFISGEDGYRGIHPLKYIKEADVQFLKKLMGWSGDCIKMITIAAEIEGAANLSVFAKNKGIVVSLGHQHANETQINRLASKGASALTHLGNGIPHLVNRHDNPIWSGLGNESLSAMIIADGFHLPVSVIKTVIKAKGINNTILVSDLSPLGGMKAGNYRIWDSDVVLARNGFLHSPATGYLAASSFTLDDCANFLLSKGIASSKEIMKMAFYNPLRLMGVSSARYLKG